MYLMEDIMQLCLDSIKLASCKWYDQIPKYKLNKEIKYLTKKIMDDDIFHLSRAFVNILKNLPSESKPTYTNDKIMFLPVSDSLLIKITDCEVSFRAKANNFKVTIFDADGDNTYYVYENTKLPKKISTHWEPATIEIKKIYLKIILNVSKELCAFQSMQHKETVE